MAVASADIAGPGLVSEGTRRCRLRTGDGGVTLALPCVVGFFPVPPAAQIDGRARIQPQAELQPGLLEHRRIGYGTPGMACKQEGT